MEADRFYRRMLKIAKEHKEESRRLELIESAFSEALPELPDNLSSDLFWECSEALDLKNRSDRDSFHEAAIALTKVIELFREDYGNTEGDFPDALWDVIRDCVNDYALDLDEGLLNYIMTEIVNQGKI